MCCHHRYGFRTDVLSGVRQRRHHLDLVAHRTKVLNRIKPPLHLLAPPVQAAPSPVHQRQLQELVIPLERKEGGQVCQPRRPHRHRLHQQYTHQLLLTRPTFQAVPLTRLHPLSPNKWTDGQLALPQMLSPHRDFNRRRVPTL